MTKIVPFPTPEPQSSLPPLCTCPNRGRTDDEEVPVEKWIGVPSADRDLWLLTCPNCNGTTAEQRRDALNLALAAAATAEKAVIAAHAARSRARNAIARANQISANARLLGSLEGLPPRLTVPQDL